MTARIKKIIKLIGPYPYNSYLIFLFFFALFLSRFITLIAYLPVGHQRWRAGIIVILVSAVPAGVYAAGAAILTKYRFWSEKSTTLYILEVAVFQYSNFLFLPRINDFLQQQLGHSNQTLITLNLNVFIGSLILVLIALALMHQAERKISERLLFANKLVKKLENERHELIHSDEEIRKQTSQFLHDRVQSDLMVVGMKLRSISGQSSPEVNEVIERAINRLENTRAADLKNLIQVLTPNLEAGTFSSALGILLERYRQTMEISLEIDELSEALPPETKLGVYRIIEQAILNALIHGPATKVQIEVSTDTDATTKIIVSDNGPGSLLEEVSPGVGSAIIDSWVGIFGGSRQIVTSPGHGYRLEVSFPSP